MIDLAFDMMLDDLARTAVETLRPAVLSANAAPAGEPGEPAFDEERDREAERYDYEREQRRDHDYFEELDRGGK